MYFQFMTQDKNISEDLKHTKVVMNMAPTEGVIGKLLNLIISISISNISFI